MWDAHHCVTAARRVVEMAPRVNTAAAGLREQGALIVHAPGGCVGFYNDTPARMRAIQAPQALAPGPIDWKGWDHDEEAALPRTLTAPGPWSCDSAEPCCQAGPPYPWTRQTPLIDIGPDDAVSDESKSRLHLLILPRFRGHGSRQL